MPAKPTIITSNGQSLGAYIENDVIKPQKEWAPGYCLVTYSALTKVSVNDGENPYIEKEDEDNEEIEVLSTVAGNSPKVVDLDDETDTLNHEAIDFKEEPLEILLDTADVLERDMCDKIGLKDTSPIYSEDEDEEKL